jgi:polysaccharide export outer membrane protein
MKTLALVRRSGRAHWASLLTLSLLFSCGVARGETYRLAPGTKIDVGIVQWNPSKGAYERWEALGGVFLVSPDGTISLPVIGSIEAAGRAQSEIAAGIAAALKAEAGLLTTPEVTVGIVEYPPFYVVGAVTAPGAYQYKPGLTVLQGLAISGGEYRPEVRTVGADEITLRGDLATIRADILRLLGRVARLRAETAGDSEIQFPPEMLTSSDRRLVSEITALETAMFSARTSEMRRKLATLSELRDLYEKEIEVLGVKNAATDRAVERVRVELEGVQSLVSRGIATVSRRSELERTVATMEADRLGGDAAIMGVRQKLSEASRQVEALRDGHQTAIATELRNSRADLDRLRTRESTVLRSLSSGLAGQTASPPDGRALAFTIVRGASGGSVEIAASETTPLEPGDVLEVEVRRRAAGEEADPIGETGGGVGPVVSGRAGL